MKIFKWLLLFLSLFILPIQAESSIPTSVTPECYDAVNSTLIDSSYSSANISGLTQCKEDLFINNLTNKILYIIYGDVIIDGLSHISSIASFDMDEASVKSHFQELRSVVDASVVIKTFTSLINYAGFLLLGAVYVKCLLNYRNGKLDASFVKNNLKVITGLSLFVPMDFFDGYSTIQYVVLLSVIVSVIIANIMWSVSTFAIELMSLKNNVFDDKEITTMLSSELEGTERFALENIVYNINAHICDIRKIEKSFSVLMPNQKTMSNLKQNELYQCLESADPSIHNLALNYDNIPKRFIKSNKCLEKVEINDIYSDIHDYCGSFHDYDDNAIIEMRNGLKLNSEEYQDKIRQVALDIFKYTCSERNFSNYGTSNKKFYCMDQDINYNYKTNGDMLVSINKIERTQEERENERLELAEKIRALLPVSSTGNLQDIIGIIKKGNLKSGLSIEQLSTSIANSIDKGWLGSTSIYFSKPKIDFNLANAKNTLESAYKFDESRVTNIKRSSDAILKESDKLLDIFKKTVTELSAHDRSQYVEKMNEMNKNKEEQNKNFSLFNIINIGGNNIINCIEDQTGACLYSSLNPLNDIILEGSKILNISSFGMAGTLIIEKTLTSIHENEDNDVSISKAILAISSTLTSAFSFAVVLGLFMSFALPLIPFFVFASVVVGWIAQIFRTIIAVQFLSILFFVPTQDEDFEGQEAEIYKMLVNIIISPMFLVIGTIVCFVMIHIVIAIVNTSFALIIDHFNITENVNTIFGYSILELLNNIFALSIYIVIVGLMIIKCSTVIYKIPAALNEWFGLRIETEQKLFQHLENIVSKILFFEIKL